MTTTLGQVIEDQLKCPICYDRIDDARILPCGHSFCRKCLDAVITNKQQEEDVTEVECPYCRTEFDVDEIVENGLNRNLLAIGLVTAMKGVEIAPKPTQTSKDVCAKHLGIQQKFFCEQCQVLACSECILLEHFGHGGRPKTLEDIRGIIAERAKTLVAHRKGNTASCSERENSLYYIRSEGDQILQHLENDVLEEFEIQRVNLEEAKDRLLAHVEALKKSFRAKMKKALEAEQTTISQLSEIGNIVDRNGGIKAECSPADLVTGYKISNSWAVNVDGVGSGRRMEDPEAELEKLKSLYFEKSSTSTTIGFIGYRDDLFELESDIIVEWGSDF